MYKLTTIEIEGRNFITDCVEDPEGIELPKSIKNLKKIMWKSKDGNPQWELLPDGSARVVNLEEEKAKAEELIMAKEKADESAMIKVIVESAKNTLDPKEAWEKAASEIRNFKE